MKFWPIGIRRCPAKLNFKFHDLIFLSRWLPIKHESLCPKTNPPQITCSGVKIEVGIRNRNYFFSMLDTRRGSAERTDKEEELRNLSPASMVLLLHRLNYPRGRPTSREQQIRQMREQEPQPQRLLLSQSKNTNNRCLIIEMT